MRKQILSLLILTLCSSVQTAEPKLKKDEAIVLYEEGLALAREGEIHASRDKLKRASLLDPNNKEIQISICDKGIGIPPEHLSHIFDRFYRVDKSRSRQAGGGSGIGLTIARALVEAHSGRIWVESAGDGKGSTFAFTLPIAK